MFGQKVFDSKPDVPSLLTREKVASLSSAPWSGWRYQGSSLTASSSTAAGVVWPHPFFSASRGLFRWWHSLRAGDSEEGEPRNLWTDTAGCDLGALGSTETSHYSWFQARHCQVSIAWPLFKWRTSRLDSMTLSSLLHEAVTFVQSRWKAALKWFHYTSCGVFKLVTKDRMGILLMGRKSSLKLQWAKVLKAHKPPAAGP